MSSHKQHFHFLPFLTGAQFQITESGRDILRGIFVGMCRVTANATAKRLLIRSVFSIHVIR
jgi:hypothetical protein